MNVGVDMMRASKWWLATGVYGQPNILHQSPVRIKRAAVQAN